MELRERLARAICHSENCLKPWLKDAPCICDRVELSGFKTWQISQPEADAVMAEVQAELDELTRKGEDLCCVVGNLMMEHGPHDLAVQEAVDRAHAIIAERDALQAENLRLNERLVKCKEFGNKFAAQAQVLLLRNEINPPTSAEMEWATNEMLRLQAAHRQVEATEAKILALAEKWAGYIHFCSFNVATEYTKKCRDELLEAFNLKQGVMPEQTK